MSVRLAFQICTYLLIVDGLAALALARLLEPASWPFIILVVMASWLHEAVRARAAARTSTTSANIAGGTIPA